MQKKQSFTKQVLMSSVGMTHPVRLAESESGRRGGGKEY